MKQLANAVQEVIGSAACMTRVSNVDLFSQTVSKWLRRSSAQSCSIAARISRSDMVNSPSSLGSISFRGHRMKEETVSKFKKTNGERRPRRAFTDEFKASAVRLVLEEGKSVGSGSSESQRSSASTQACAKPSRFLRW